ncbi:MAG: hypothetical protein ACI9XK_003341 [Granulosicoccus sp.]
MSQHETLQPGERKVSTSTSGKSLFNILGKLSTAWMAPNAVFVVRL